MSAAVVDAHRPEDRAPRPADVRAGALLTIDLDAIAANWQLLRSRLAPGAECAAVLKADAYGLGAARVGPALAAAGCRRFFVAHLDEAIALRPHLPPAARVHVLHGPTPGSEAEFVAHGVHPVLNSRAQLDGWRTLAHRLDRELAAMLQIDTGMARLGLPAGELAALGQTRDALLGLRLDGVMSHLACADDPAHPANAAQREAFDRLRRRLPALAGVPASLANSSGIFLGPAYHHQLVRPGAALYGIAPVPGAPNPMRPVVRLQAKVIQTRCIEAGAGVGYGMAFAAQRPTRIATIAVGYADGWLRSLGGRGAAWWQGIALPIAGRVSMDTVTLDASAAPEGALAEGDTVDLIGPQQDVDAVAAHAGTIGYEILTALGLRYARRYEGGVGR